MLLKDELTFDEDGKCSHEVRIGGVDGGYLTYSIEKVAAETPAIDYGNADGKDGVNNDDAILIMRYVAGWSSAADIINLDNANADAKLGVNNDDAILIMRYVAGWSSAILGPQTQQ